MNNEKLLTAANKYINEIDELSKIIFKFYYNDDLTIKEICTKLNMSYYSVKKTLDNINVFLATKFKMTDLLSPFIIEQRNKYKNLVKENGEEKIVIIINKFDNQSKMLLNLYIEGNRKILYFDIPLILKNGGNYTKLEETISAIEKKVDFSYIGFKSKNRDILLSLLKKIWLSGILF